MSWRNREEHWMRKSEAEIEVRPLDRGLEADSLNLELLGETLAHADDHVIDQGARKTVQCLHTASFGIAD